MSVTGKGKYLNPGDFDPVVNENLQLGLQKKYNGAIFKRSKDKIALVINALASVYRNMQVGGRRPWWDNTNFVVEIPNHVSNLCMQRKGSPDPEDCVAASFNFIRTGQTPTIRQGKPIVFRSSKGNPPKSRNFSDE